MSSISQGPTQTDQANAGGNITNQPVDYSDKSVKRGYSDDNSYSRTAGKEAIQSNTPKPQLDVPVVQSNTDIAEQDVLDDFKRTSENQVTDQIRGEITDTLKKKTKLFSDGANRAAEENASQTSAEGERQKKTSADSPAGRSQANTPSGQTPDAPSSGKAPADSPDGKVPAGASPSATSTAGASATATAAANTDAAAKTQQVDIPTVEQWDRFSETFKDVYVRAGAITNAPPGLREEIQSEFSKFTQKVLSGEQTLDVDSATTMLVAIQTKLQDNRIQFDQETIKIRQVEFDQKYTESISKIRDSIAEAQKAKSSGLIGKIFGWIAVAVMAVVTVIVSVVSLVPVILSGGAAAGLAVLAIALMATALATTITMMASQEAGSTWMMDIFGDSKDAKIGAMVFWTALVILLSVGGAVAGGAAGAAAGAGASAGAGAANMASSGASTGASVSATAANSAATTATLAAKASNIASNLAKVMQAIAGAAMVGEGSAQIATSVYSYKADILRADAQEDRAFMLRIQQAIDDATESLANAIDELQQGYSIAASIIKANHETKTTLSRNLRA